MYHQVASPAPAAYAHYTVAPSAFARQMRTLAALGYRAIALDRLLAARTVGTPLPKRSVVITFDDGFAGAVREAAPILEHHRFTATFFVVAGLIGSTSEWTRRRGIEMPLADVNALRELAEAGFTIGSHTLTHRRLADLPASEARYELLESKRRLEDAFGRETRHFAYPYGSTSELVRAAVAECGYSTACTTTEGISPASDDLLMLRRVPVHGSDSLADFVCRLRTGRTVRTWLTASA
jgi:peptidoglycan/xylan/chitin deacetylase (PgdA/CDA1 family)